MQVSENKIEIIKRLKEIRLELNITSGEFAKGAGIDPRNYSSIENFKKTIGPRILRDICLAYSINISYLTTGIGEKFIKKEDDKISDLDSSNYLSSVLEIIKNQSESMRLKDQQALILSDSIKIKDQQMSELIEIIKHATLSKNDVLADEDASSAAAG